MHNTLRYSEGKIGTSPEVWDGQVVFRSSLTLFFHNLAMNPLIIQLHGFAAYFEGMKREDTNSYPIICLTRFWTFVFA